jgi:hypothetical protein
MAWYLHYICWHDDSNLVHVMSGAEVPKLWGLLLPERAVGPVGGCKLFI